MAAGQLSASLHSIDLWTKVRAALFKIIRGLSGISDFKMYKTNTSASVNPEVPYVVGMHAGRKTGISKVLLFLLRKEEIIITVYKLGSTLHNIYAEILV
jgi:hypothetical protein